MVLPILSYASSAWYPNVSGMRSIESTQRKATKWIIGDYDLDYKKRLLRTNILPLSLYLELNDLLFLSKIISSSYDFDWRRFITFSSRRGRVFDIPYVHLENSRRNFWYRSCRLTNLINRTLDFRDAVNLKRNLLVFYWKHFHEIFNINNSCSWRVLCLCPNCRQLSTWSTTREKSLHHLM
jgi:hypothetical protein